MNACFALAQSVVSSLYSMIACMPGLILSCTTCAMGSISAGGTGGNVYDARVKQALLAAKYHTGSASELLPPSIYL